MMKFKDICNYILQERKKVDTAINNILLKYGNHSMSTISLAADPIKLEKQNGLFDKKSI